MDEDASRFRIERFTSIRSAQRVLRELPSTGATAQHVTVLRAVERCWWRCRLACPWLWVREAFRRLKGEGPFRVYVVRDAAQRVVCVAPLQREPSGAWSVVAGDVIPLDAVDFVYAERPADELRAAVLALKAQLKKDGLTQLTWLYLEARSITNLLLANEDTSVSGETPSVCIPLSETGGPRVSRNVRKHLHVAANRIRRANLKMRVEIYSACGLGLPLDTVAGRQTLRACRQVYLHRQAQRYAHAGGRARFYFKNCNYVSLSVPGEIGCLVVLWIGTEIGAYLEGYVNRARRAVEFPRVAINGKWAWYSPGILLLDAVSTELARTTPIRFIDLGRGDERYKLEMGGAIYQTRTLVWNFSKVK